MDTGILIPALLFYLSQISHKKKPILKMGKDYTQQFCHAG
ncbi:hypothetical protein SGGMMB4_03223 [Sodalis glossinidius str. 'morsitans']|uniref:Uncharacterized protein n=1 Tax=Sodalis glossinidius (strain morsitans) TaxID=343509 RepID=A0A193QJV9_SODGM|nr:hypothetical protein SGGMMB4_03223 [Sodalis glossinidius str. 'morsitans']